MRNLRITPFKQSPSHCGPTSVKMVLHYYGIHATEKEIAKRAKTTLSHGTRPKNLLAATKTYGLQGKWKTNGTIRDLYVLYKKGIPTIVNWFSETEGHYSVVIGINAKHVILMDPTDGKSRSFEHETFMKIWFDFPFPWIKNRSELRIRHYLALYPKKK